MAVLIGNSFNVMPGQRGFDLLTNRCDYFEIGSSAGEDVWLEGTMAGPDGDFIFNGRLFHSGGSAGTIIDGFPKAVPDGWTKRPSQHCEGYDLVDKNGEVIFGYRVSEDGICEVNVSLYRGDGEIAATGGQGGLVTNGVPVRLGRHGIVISDSKATKANPTESAEG
ncbi:hypothetical protein H9L12_06030 [Sphingomonas rhizophila]|uniref:Uncharacterized protein n=1 Tax=Sphingomonas rhizophila TaxID=2071607 RepID=A0A7G9SDX1_9SPHN|nr:hypothetical protein [Sphingomonas rhizophila]QNN66046.1 hypothetical protein H9L12_06030 [Sphingomonas rhizophila]